MALGDPFELSRSPTGRQQFKQQDDDDEHAGLPRRCARTACRVAERLLYGYADRQTDPTHPLGYLGVNCALPCSEDADAVRRMLAAVRKKTNERLRKRFAKAKLDRDLPSGVDLGTLARLRRRVG